MIPTKTIPTKTIPTRRILTKIVPKRNETMFNVSKTIFNESFILLMKLIVHMYFYFFVWLLRPVLAGGVRVGVCEARPLDAAF